jgi:hypothetical protein
LLLLHQQWKMCPWFSCLQQEKILLWLYLKRWLLLRELWWISLSRMLRRRKKGKVHFASNSRTPRPLCASWSYFCQ